MPPQIISLGELLVEIMRTRVDEPLSQPGKLVGPFPSGAPAIFIDAAARLGMSTGFIGVVGRDAFGDCVLNRLQADGVDIQCVRKEAGYTTGTAFVAYRSDGTRNFVFHLSQAAASLLHPDDVRPEYVASAAFVHITGSALSYSLSARQACYKAVRIVKSAGGRVSFDPNIRSELMGLDKVRAVCEPVLTYCDLLLPSGPEATMLTGIAQQDAACRALVARGIPIVALKQGSVGSTVYTINDTIHASPLAVTEIDPTGAGDCYGGAFVVGLLEGWDLAKTARFANVAGALSVTQVGPMEGAAWRDRVLAQL